MATNFSDIGFAAHDSAALEKLGRKCFANGRATRCAQGLYICWELGQGIELWAQLNKSEELLGLNPFFQGQTRANVGLQDRIARNGQPMEGGFKSMAQPEAREPLRGAFPF